MARASTYAIGSDLSGVVETPDGFGKFETKLAAVDRWIDMLEGEREEIAEKLARAKRTRRRLVAARNREAA